MCSLYTYFFQTSLFVHISLSLLQIHSYFIEFLSALSSHISNDYSQNFSSLMGHMPISLPPFTEYMPVFLSFQTIHQLSCFLCYRIHPVSLSSLKEYIPHLSFLLHSTPASPLSLNTSFYIFSVSKNTSPFCLSSYTVHHFLRCH